MTLRSAGARAAVLGFAAFLPVGLATMNGSIGFMDRGELAGVASTWGIAHPTGYPTLMLIAGALVHLVPLRPVLVLNVFAAVLVALGTGCLTLVMDSALARLRPELDARPRAMLALASALVTSFSVTWWQQANGFEVYPLHCVLMPLVVWLALRWIKAAASPDALVSRRERRRGFAFALVTGLAFTNHLTTSLLAPGLIALACTELGVRGLARRLPRLALPFLAGLLPYAWLPLRAAMNPVLNWGDPRTWSAFLHHVTGSSYHSLMFTGARSLAQQARFAAVQLPWDYMWVGLVVVAVGAVWMGRRDRRLLLFVALTASAGVGFAINYSVGDIDPYLLTTTLALGLCLAAGLLFVHERWGSRAALAMGATLIALNLVGHWHDCDERGNGVPEAFFRDLVTPLPREAVLFTPIWGQAESPAWYFQNVERVRDDVVIVDPDLVRVKWYLEALARRAPDLIARVPGEYTRYLSDLRDAEAGRPYDGRTVDAARQELLTALALAAMRDRQVFSTDRSPELPAGAMRVPYHLAFRLTLDTAYVAEPPHRYAYRPWDGRMDADVAMTCRYYAESRVGRALYEQAYGHGAAVLPLVVSATAFDPHIRPQSVSPLPAATDQLVLQVAGYFQNLDRTLETLEARAAARGRGLEAPAPQRRHAGTAAGTPLTGLSEE